MGYMSLKCDLSKFPTILISVPPLSEVLLKRDLAVPRTMRVYEDILKLPSFRLKLWLRKLSEIGTHYLC